MGLVCCCLFCIAFAAIAQERYIDSIKRILPTVQNDSLRIDLYNRIFFHYIFLNTDSAAVYANKSFEASKRTDHKRGLAIYYNNVGILNRVEGDFDEAIKHLLQSLKINEEIAHELGIGNNYMNIGLVYAVQHKYELALKYYQKALVIKIKNKESTGIGYCYRDIGDVYAEMGNYPKAIENYEKCLEHSKRRLGLAYRALMSLGIVYHKLGKTQQAYDYLFESLEGLKKEEVFEVATACNAIGKILMDTKEYDKAHTWFEQAVQFARQYKHRMQLKEAYKNLAHCYKLQNNTELAYDFLQRYTNIQDSLFNVESSERILRLQNSFSLRKKENEIQVMQKEQELKGEKQRMFTFGVFAFGFVGCLLLVIFYNNDRKTRKTNKILQNQRNDLTEKNEEINQQKEEIQALNENLEQKIKERTHELDTVVSELHQRNKGLSEFSYIVAHNIRAPLASVKGLLSLIDYTIVSPAHLEILVHIQKTIENFETVVTDLDEILEIRDTQQISLEKISISDMTDMVLRKFKNEIRRNKAKILTDFQEASEIYTNKAYLFDVLFNLLSNAIKYQSDARALEIYVGTEVSAKYVILEVRDNGIGIDLSKTDKEKIFGMHQRMHTHVEGKGFGLYLVKNIVEALHGKITVESEVNKGTSFKVYFPKTEEL